MSKQSKAGDFQDPLENYDPKSYADQLEEAICEWPSSRIQHEPFTTIAADTSVADAVKKLAADHVACLMVEEEGKLVGLFTNREVLNQVALEADVSDRPVRDVMTKNPVFVHEDDPVAASLCVMAVHGYRHVPIVSPSDQEIKGVVSPQRVLSLLSKNFDDAD